MAWLQENWIIAVVGLVVAVALLWLLLRRKAPDIIAPPAAAPTKPLEPRKPEIIAAEPARFKPVEPAPPPVAPAPPPAEAVAAPPPPAPKAEESPKPNREAAPAAAPTPVAEPAPAPAAAAPAPVAKADNLQLLKGVGPKMVTLLGGLGITRYAQIANWTDADIATIDPQLGAFQGRIVRDNLVDQAAYLAKGDRAGFEAKYGALGGEL